ncbi:hypothetical protein PUMCH_003946 [Australozyma saopauloensis]|uniref:Uncharacterized protein n=1 Tax=Australozyma saopauloensis TaxID=291208 RepID=A0AAX4HD90_9ASCO|nr:hypothetical protein PUMCH_003946 [[Candida] saopauloensis]
MGATKKHLKRQILLNEPQKSLQFICVSNSRKRNSQISPRSARLLAFPRFPIRSWLQIPFTLSGKQATFKVVSVTLASDIEARAPIHQNFLRTHKTRKILFFPIFPPIGPLFIRPDSVHPQYWHPWSIPARDPSLYFPPKQLLLPPTHAFVAGLSNLAHLHLRRRLPIRSV